MLSAKLGDLLGIMNEDAPNASHLDLSRIDSFGKGDAPPDSQGLLDLEYDNVEATAMQADCHPCRQVPPTPKYDEWSFNFHAYWIFPMPRRTRSGVSGNESNHVPSAS